MAEERAMVSIATYMNRFEQTLHTFFLSPPAIGSYIAFLCSAITVYQPYVNKTFLSTYMNGRLDLNRHQQLHQSLHQRVKQSLSLTTVY
jgi:hypothetical protein